MTRRAFTLVEMILATALAAILLGGVLLSTAAVSRDTARARAAAPTEQRGAIDLLQWDLTNAASMREIDEGRTIVLTGQCALDRKMLAPTGRLARVDYRIDPRTRTLTREQRFLDDTVRPEPWTEIVATDITRLDIVSNSATTKPDAQGNLPIPSRMSVSLIRSSGTSTAEVRAR